jgi:hypothetical protein
VRRLRSLRLRAVIVVALVACGPLLVVAASDGFERGAARRMERNLEGALDAVVANPDRAATVADDRNVWVRLLRDDVEEHDGDAESWWVLLGHRLFAADGAPTLAEFDAARAELRQRRVVRAALEGQRAAACLPSDGGLLVVCEVAAPIEGGVAYLA